MNWSNEVKVGLFVLITGAIIAVAGVWSVDGVWGGEPVYRLDLSVPSADGLWLGTPVKIAGVEIGSMEEPHVAGDHAELSLQIRNAYQLPVDSVAELRTSGLIGDRYINVIPGSSETLLHDGDKLILSAPPPDLEKIEKQVETITEDLQAITKILRQMVEADANREHIEATLANIDALSAEMREMAAQNHGDVNAIVDSIRRLSTSLEGFANDTRGDVREEMAKLQSATDKLDQTIGDVRSVTSKIDSGEGTIGALVNDRTTVDLINETVGNANQIIDSFSGMHAEVYYIGRQYFGSQPTDRDTFFFGNPLAGQASNTVGMRLMPQEDFWYNFEMNDHPMGTVTYKERFFPDSGQVYTEYLREPNYRITFMMNKRFRNLGLRLGIKESGGGIGVSYWMLRNKLELQADIFDADLGAYPATGAMGIPNARFLARYSPINHLFVEAGTEQPFLGLKYGYHTGFVGFGFHFTDDDVKLLFATLPLGF